MAITTGGDTLIVAESHGNRLTGYDIGRDGRLARRRTWADAGDDHPDGICLDADGAIWYADVGNRRCVRVGEGGDVLCTPRPRRVRLHAQPRQSAAAAVRRGAGVGRPRAATGADRTDRRVPRPSGWGRETLDGLTETRNDHSRF